MGNLGREKANGKQREKSKRTKEYEANWCAQYSIYQRYDGVQTGEDMLPLRGVTGRIRLSTGYFIQRAVRMDFAE